MMEKKTPPYKHILKYGELATRVNEVSSNVDINLYEARDALWDVAKHLSGSTIAQNTGDEIKRLSKIREAITKALDVMEEYDLLYQSTLLTEIEKAVIKAELRLKEGSTLNRG